MIMGRFIKDIYHPQSQVCGLVIVIFSNEPRLLLYEFTLAFSFLSLTMRAIMHQEKTPKVISMNRELE